MFRVSDLIDLPIKQLKNKGNPKHTVKSVLIDKETNRAAALICKEGTIKKNFKIIPYERIIAIDIDGVIVSDETCIAKVKTKEIENYMQFCDIVNRTVTNPAGKLQGILTDVFINLLNGRITAYEISEGYLDDFVKGRKVISENIALKNNVNSDGITIYHRLDWYFIT